MSVVLLTPDEAARLLGLSPFTVRRLLRQGEIPGRKVGKRQWRIRRADLDQYLSMSSTSTLAQGLQMPQHKPTRIEQLATEQGVLPITDFNLLLGDPWPEDENVEEFLDIIRELRQSSVAGSDF